MVILISFIANKKLLDNQNKSDIITLLKRWCWNWQTGVVEGHVPIRREGSTPSQRIG